MHQSSTQTPHNATTQLTVRVLMSLDIDTGCHDGAVVSQVVSQQEGPGVES